MPADLSAALERARIAALWGERCIEKGIARREPFQAYWRAVLAVRAAREAVALREKERNVLVAKALNVGEDPPTCPHGVVRGFACPECEKENKG